VATTITTRDINFGKHAFLNVKTKLKFSCGLGSMLESATDWLNHIIQQMFCCVQSSARNDIIAVNSGLPLYKKIKFPLISPTF